MGFFTDFKRLMTGKYITVDEIANQFEMTEIDARVRLDTLVSNDVFKEIQDGVYVPTENIQRDELVDSFQTQFEDLNSEVTDELTHLDL